MVDKAECRGCGKELEGNPYYTGKPAWIKTSKKYGSIRAPSCHYGGHVCSESCDRRASLSLEASMPGSGGEANRLMGNLEREITEKWDYLRRQYPGAGL